MSLLQSIKDNTAFQDIRYALFKRYILIAGVLSILFGLINFVNKRPFMNILTAIVAFAICFICYVTSRNQERYLFSRLLFAMFVSFILVPIGYLTSPGSNSAILYLISLFMLMTAVIAVNKWEYIFPVLIIIQMPILLRTEIWFPEIYYQYTDQVYRINDITVNYIVVLIGILLTVQFMMIYFKKHTDILYKTSITDGLTGLYNRRYFFEFAEMEYNRSLRKGITFTIIFIDLNHFKMINDTYGHLQGDEVLKEVSNIILDNIRSYDIAARYGGDEFIIMLPNTDIEETHSYISRLEDNFISYSKKYQSVNFAVGFGYANSKDKTLKEIISLADMRLYENKEKKK